MKEFFRLLFGMFCLFVATIPLHAQWTVMQGSNGYGVVECLGGDSSHIFFGTSLGFFRTTNNGVNWTTSDPNYTHSTLNSGGVMYAGTSSGVKHSTDMGTTWTWWSTGLSSPYTTALCALGANVFAGITTAGSGAGVFRSSDIGVTWFTTGLTTGRVSCFAVNGASLFAGTTNFGIYRSTNNGTNWGQINSGLTNTHVNALATVTDGASNVSIFAGTDFGMFRSTDNGNTWAATTVTSTVYALATVGVNLISADVGINLSSDNGANWTASYAGNTRALFVAGTKLYEGNFDGTVNSRLLTDIGLPVELTSFSASSKLNSVELKWNTATEVNNYGFEIERSEKLRVKNEKWERIGFVEGTGTSNAPKEYSFTDNNLSSGRYSYRLKQIDHDGKFEYSQSVEVTIGQAPALFELAQNFPNPFNPSTTLQYGVPTTSRVKLQIYNVLGQVVEELINTEQQAGYQSVVWNTNVSSGLYFYRLEAVSVADPSKRFVETKKMLLLR